LKLQIKEFCIRCGICITLYPDLYEMDYQEDIIRIKVGNVPENLLKNARQSINDCAVTAIYQEK
jgi:ferredoxin